MPHKRDDLAGQRVSGAEEQPGEPGDGVLFRRTGRVLARVVMVLRLVAVPPLVSAILTAMHTNGYSTPALATAVYGVLAVWWVAFPLVVWRHDTVPAWALVTDVAVVAGSMFAIGFAVRVAFLSSVAYSDLEAAMVVTAVTVAMNAPVRWVLASCGVLAIAHLTAEIPAMRVSAGSIVGTLADLGWLAGAVIGAGMLAHHLRTASRYLDSENDRLLAQREQLAAQQARTAERSRSYQEQIRRYRALHDGPMSILTAVGGRGPLAHPNEHVRRQCAIGANLLRGLIPDGPNSTLTDLSVALIKAGTDCALRGLRVEYQFSELPTDLRPELVEALSGASREALNNVAAHAGVDKAWLTTLITGDPDAPAVTVAIVDQGKGFDPAGTPFGRGLTGSVLARMAEVGGAATVDSFVGQGTRIELRWPR